MEKLDWPTISAAMDVVRAIQKRLDKDALEKLLAAQDGTRTGFEEARAKALVARECWQAIWELSASEEDQAWIRQHAAEKAAALRAQAAVLDAKAGGQP